MIKVYIAFGKGDNHYVDGKHLDSNTVAVINCDSFYHGRMIAHRLFGTKWEFSYHEDDWFDDNINSYSKGYVECN